MPSAASITAQKGRAFLLKVSDGTSPTTYVTVTGLRATGIQINSNPVDITNKSSAGWRELLPDGGIRQVTFTGSGLVDSASAQLITLESAALNGTLIEAQVISGKGDSLMGTFAVSAFQRDGTHNDAETFSVTLENSGPVTYSAT